MTKGKKVPEEVPEKEEEAVEEEEEVEVEEAVEEEVKPAEMEVKDTTEPREKSPEEKMTWRVSVATSST